ncbi:TonB-dependent siderophore receptor [Acinetobacter bereziniae]|uniref:TonB-dependent receptor family protein n=1 Tax=Acinetobacter bereziniae TaxID=106648 RepID=UPI001580FCB3|nr:TonB-dependent siderophore receptor [Acinetobacter bereziniae]NUF62013.1 TonB-dependent siderophore receptor [Acinetobacter bereziniae]NUG07457.1 TonB-dependent siderophore receptor [Acinetobacter bereziniae]NUG63223.1 TonB-dependent siderophore receptor [Acinetobacter bereziniae]NUG69366.1 TonB-dependent siderophore receptor [Acinetobacter bereziniae]NUG81717.1 TonB-dependent siderophore receptor [Acinetobacter bereziniae]
MNISIHNTRCHSAFKPSPLSLAIAVSFSFISVASYAEDIQEDTPKALKTITVQAEGNWLEETNAEKVHKHAGARSIVDRKKMDESAVTSIRDALKQVPGVQVQDSNGTGGSDVSLNLGVRGLTSRLSPRSTVLMDGVPLSFAPYGQPQLSMAPVSMGNIESIDVVRGAGTVRFGPQNVGGIINFNTRAIPEKLSGSVGLTTEFATGTDQLKYSPNLFVGGTMENGLGLALLYSGTKGNGYREANNDIDIDDVMLKSSYQFNDQDALAVNLHHYEGRGEMPEGLTTADYAKNPYQSNQFRNYFAGRRSDVSVKYSHKDELNNFEVLGYYVDSFRTSDLESAIEGTANSRISNSPRDYKYFGIEPRYSRAYSLGNMNNEVTVGYRYLQEDSSEFSGRTTPYNTATGIPGERLANTISDGGTKAHALYIDNRFGLGAFTITPGVRFESIKTHNNYSAYQSGKFINTVHPKIKSDEFLPSLALQYNFNDQWNIFANAAVSFGPQQYNQLAKVDAGQAVTTLDGLHHEKSNNYEIGTKYLGNGLNAELTVFYLDFDKELILERPDNIGTGIWTNLGATSHKGIELGLNYDFGHLYDMLEGLKVYSNYTFTKAVSEAGKFEGKDLPYYSRHVGNLGLGYTFDKWSVNADMFAQSKQHAPGSGNIYQTVESADGRIGDIPGYSTFAVRTGYDFGEDFYGLKIAAGIKNLFDKEYFTRSSDSTGGKYVGQPRTFYLQTSVNF